MKSNVRLIAVALTLSLAAAAHAQVWSTVAAGCVPDQASKALISAAYGTVSFAAGKNGHIKLSCPIFAVPANSGANALFLTFYDNNGFSGGVNHCYITADLLRSNLSNIEGGADLTTVVAGNQSFNGRQVVWASFNDPLDLTTSYYWVDVDLYRDSGTASCNPTVVGTYVGGIIP